MALAKVAKDDPLQTDLAEIITAARRSAEMTRQLLGFARRQTVMPKVVDLNDTVEGILKMLRRLIGEDIALVWLPTKSTWPVKIDPSQVDQILANLCVNARDAINGVGKITIQTSKVTLDNYFCHRHPGAVPGQFMMLAVSDDGCGMNVETTSHLFEPFFTTKEVGKGTGLGLATVYGIVKQNNGYIDFQSEPDRGTSFRIYLPRSTGEADASPKDETNLDLPGSETVLLVEDEPSVLQMAAEMLGQLGYRVLPATSSAQALHLAENHRDQIDLLVTDVVMPEMSGKDLAEKLKKFYPHLKTLFMSGYTADVIAHQGVLDEAACFIQKPFSRKALSVKLREAMAG
jgi:CheY-like chemotaxis protein